MQTCASTDDFSISLMSFGYGYINNNKFISHTLKDYLFSLFCEFKENQELF